MLVGRLGLAVLAALGLSGCLHRQSSPAPGLVAAPHYALGPAYKSAGFWYYPAENYALDTTGLASVQPATGAGLTADGELRDPAALTAAMQTLQLPAVVEVTNLENGRKVLIRVNDRGPASPARVIAVSSHAAVLLAMPAAGVARVRVRLDQMLSRTVMEQVGGGPKLAIATAPAAAVLSEALAAPGSASGPARPVGRRQVGQAAAQVPDRLPEQVTMSYAEPGTLMIQAGRFGCFTYANIVAAKLAGLGADVVQSNADRQTVYSVQAGPFSTVAQADQALDQALRAGVVDARIVIQ